MEIYLKNLIKQFTSANGIKNIDVNSETFVDEFAKWLKIRKGTGKQYTCFLDYLDFNFAESTCAEVGKGKYDSVVAPFETTIITTVPKKFAGVNPNRIITGNMQILDGQPMLLKYRENLNLVEPIPIDIITTYMTQNPFSHSNILGWEDVHNCGNNIIVGIYGNTYDKDYDQKINQIKLLKERLYGEYKEEYTVDGDNYYYVVGTEKIVKKLYNYKTKTK